VRTVRPVRDRGRNLLMLDENMWVYVPNLKRSVRVSLNQKLVGQAANGDISRMRWSGDYSAVLESDNATEWQLLLTATKRGLTYEKLRVWVEKGSFHPLRAEYLSVGLKPLKRATFRAYKDLCGKVRPSEILISDAVRPDDQSLLAVQQMEVRTFAASMYQPENLQ
jgi:outer membrane lipoprotein-sorting protein